MKQFAIKVAIVGVMLNLTVLFGLKSYEDVKVNEKVTEQKAIIKLLNNNPQLFDKYDWEIRKSLAFKKVFR